MNKQKYTTIENKYSEIFKINAPKIMNQIKNY